MPHATAKHPFEWMVHGWAQRLRGGAGFVAVLDEHGEVARVVDGDIISFGNRCVSHTIQERIAADEPRWIFYDPFDAPEYAYLSWAGISRPMWQRLVIDALTPEELAFFSRDGDIHDIPAAWGVMF